jgi:hypothetical protein
LSLVRAGKSWVVVLLAVLALPAAAWGSPVLEFSHGKTRVVEDAGTPPVLPADVAAAIATAAQSPNDTGGAEPPPPPPTGTPPPTTTPPAPVGPALPTGEVGRGSVPGILDQALAIGLLSQADHDAYRAVYDQAIQARSSLAGQCRKQLRNVIRDLDTMARQGTLTTSRMPALFLQLRRNTEFWTTHPRVSAAQRVKFGSSELLFQHYAGEGLQIQPLGNFGKANGLYTQCQHPTRGKPCERGKLKTLLDELLAVKSVRGGFFAWEYFFPFDGGRPPWMSGMAQATAIEALARSSQLYGDPSYTQLAGLMVGAFDRSPPVGVRVRADGGNHYLLYSFAPRYRVLNGFLQTLIGLYDYIKITGDQNAQQLFDAGNTAALRELPRYDTGKWAYYALPTKDQSSYGYMTLVTGFLDGLCARTGNGAYCATAKRWHRYLSKVPREPLRPLPPAKECGY